MDFRISGLPFAAFSAPFGLPLTPRILGTAFSRS